MSISTGLYPKLDLLTANKLLTYLPPSPFQYTYTNVWPSDESLTNYVALLWVQVGHPCLWYQMFHYHANNRPPPPLPILRQAIQDITSRFSL